MTTAARPTWAPAKVGTNKGNSNIRSISKVFVKGHRCSYYPKTQEGQDTQDELQRRNLRDELEDRERRHFSSKALLAELERLRKEKAEQKEREEREKQEEELKAKEEQLLRGNPLLNNPTSFSVKRRWDDDVVFKNQARGETKMAKRFINDTIRNDFHRKFLQKYMK
ncbi:hypothetical protein DH2020_042403 [Rehmannia glutinosa]|uniref:Cwf15/Cwc15 cell cycle control protein n=1 Tax=Rehmannia glutinosa TaxID=99300 RepID=A0ABR0UNH6_REHGL